MPKTIDQILLEIRPHRPMSRQHVYNYINSLAIRPVGVRQRPQRYPDDTAGRILRHLGFDSTPAAVVSMATLKKERAS